MGKIIRKNVGKCQIVMTEINGRVTLKCKNLKRKPTSKEAENSAQAILDSVKNKKIIYR